ncbi:uncharacterized protein (TIGR00369 family) [Sinobacterium caligoides]|uniref:Uncharacterized protein (TIGR00369 family) n=1 Tax=Sinobacterium caligoides TaxID=933926 RepID=A0A3N2DZM6_9GAMM|nr:PaaI family thioesterase [Sinobacterium caligoides]ROS05321.1 uncharacterized protein (TIGR00369 family) [Sinobacterium caligoides]
MTEDNKNTPQAPPGFQPFPEDGGFNDALAPLFMRIDDDGMTLALLIDDQHCNPIGICHGAVYMCLMDIALNAAVCHDLGKYIGAPTITITLDYMASTKKGEWLYTSANSLKSTRSIGFAEGKVYNDDGIKVRASGNYKLPENIEQAEGVAVADVKAMLNS